MKDVSLDPMVCFFEALDQVLHFSSFCLSGTRTVTGRNRQSFFLRESLNLFFLEEDHRSDDRHLSLEKGLNREHGADLRAIQDIQKEGFNDVILVVSEGDLMTVETMGNMKNAFSPFPGAEKARIFPILRTVGQPSDVCFFDVVG